MVAKVKQFGGLGLVVVCLLERLGNQGLFVGGDVFGEIYSGVNRHERFRILVADWVSSRTPGAFKGVNVKDLNGALEPVSLPYGALDNVFELTHIAPPRVL